ncbi:hypothetical protein Tco_1530831 [Tanacetum coccineum]
MVINSLRVEFNKSEFDLATYKRGLASVEEQLVFYKKNEVLFCDQIAVLKRDASFRDPKINALNIQIEKLKKRIAISLFAPLTIDLSSSGLKEFQQPEFEGYGVNVNKSVSENSSNEIKKTTGVPIIKDWVSDCDKDESEVMVSNNVQHKSGLKPEQAKQPRKISKSPRNNRTNWNEKKTQKLGVGFQFTKKACFVCGSFNHLIKDCDFHDKKMVQKPVMNNVQKGTGQREVRPVWNNALRTNHQNFSNSRRNFAPTAVLTKSGIVPISTARQRSSRAATPLSAARPINTAAPKLFVNVAKTKPNVFQKAHSLSRRPFNQQTALNNRSLNNKVNTAKVNSVNTAKGKRVTSAVGEQGINAVKSSACWGDPQVALKDTRIFDSGCSRHMTRNKSYLTDYQDYDGGFVAFAGSSKGGRITGKGEAGKENVPNQEYILLPLLHTSSNVPSNSEKDESSPKDDAGKKNEVKDSAKEGDMNGPGEATNTDSTNRLNTVSSPVNTVSSSFTTVDPGRAKEQRNEYESLFDPLIPDLEDTADLQDTGIFGSAYDDEYVGAEADLNNLETNMSVSPIPTTKIHKDHPKAQIIGEVDSAVQTRRMHKQNEAGLISFINKQRRTNHKDFQNCLFACFLSQMEPKKVTQALDDESWVEAMQEELLQFKLLNVSSSLVLNSSITLPSTMVGIKSSP